MEKSTHIEDKTNNIDNTGLWTSFKSAADRNEYFESWLALQSSFIPNIIQGILVIRESDSASYVPVARWPDGDADPERLAEISENVLEQRCGLLAELDKLAGVQASALLSYAVAYPVLIDEDLYGVAALEVNVQSAGELKAVMEQLQWGISGLELFYRRLHVIEDRSRFDRLKSATDLLTAVLNKENYNDACTSFVTELATLLDCDRVSLGVLKKSVIAVQAVSHSADIIKHMNLIRAIGMAMDEALLQRSDILYPVPPDGRFLVTKEHEGLSKMYGDASVLTIPLYGSGKYYGALTLERPSDKPFTVQDAEFCHSVSALSIPLLEIKRSQDRLLVLKIYDSVQRQLSRLFGQGYLGRKLAAISLIIIVLFFSFMKGDYRLSADTVLEGTVRRVIVAPYNGYIKHAYVRAGDVVKNGMVMCALDDRDLSLERVNWLSQGTQLARQYQDAMAKHNRAEVNVINAKRDQSMAQLNLVQSKLERANIKSPFDGFVVSGDLSQRLGGLVEQGEVLFEVAPLDSYRVILKVDESRIGDVQEGQQGKMVLSSLPNEYFEFTVEKLTPISTALEGRNYFRVEAKLKKVSERLRPGMEGVGKISVDRRKLISIWTRSLTEWLRLNIWSWWP